MNTRRILSACAVILALAGCAIDDKLPQPDKVFRIGTGSYGGVYYPYGVSACRLWNAEAALSTTRCLVQNTAGSVDNIQRLKQGRVEFALVQADVLGREILEQRAAGAPSALRLVMAGPQEALTIVVNRASDIQSGKDLKGKRIAIGPVGSGQRATAQQLFAALNIATSDVSDVPALTSGQQSRMLCTGELDAALFVSAPPSGYVSESTMACGGMLLSLDDATRTALQQANPYLKPMTIGHDVYRGQSNDIQTVGVRALILTTANQPDELVYRFTRQIAGQLETFKRQHQAFRAITPESLVEAPDNLPRHPGAERFLREARLLR